MQIKRDVSIFATSGGKDPIQEAKKIVSVERAIDIADLALKKIDAYRLDHLDQCFD